MLNNQILGLIHQELSNDNLKNVKKLSTILHPASKFSSMNFDNSQEKIHFKNPHYKLKETDIDDLILLIQNDCFSKDETPLREKIINFLINEEIKSYDDDENMDNMKDEFEIKKLEWPDFKYVKYKYKNKTRDGFADGSSVDDYGQEELKIIFKIENQVHSIYLELGFECGIHGHSGGVAGYSMDVLEFRSSRDKEYLKQDVIIASNIICSVTELATRNTDDIEFFYNHIAKHLNLN